LVLTQDNFKAISETQRCHNQLAPQVFLISSWVTWTWISKTSI